MPWSDSADRHLCTDTSLGEARVAGATGVVLVIAAECVAMVEAAGTVVR